MINQLATNRQTSRRETLGEDERSDLAVLLLDTAANVTYCNSAAGSMFGYDARDLEGCHISRVLPEFAATELVPDGRLNPRVAFLCHCGRQFRALRADGSSFATELYFNPVASRGNDALRLLVRDAGVSRQFAVG